ARPWLLSLGAGCFLIAAGAHFVAGARRLEEFPSGAVEGGRQETRLFHDACHWIREHTQPGRILLASPASKSIQYLSHRPVAVLFKQVPARHTDVLTWYQRLIDFNGGQLPAVSREVGTELDEN